MTRSAFARRRRLTSCDGHQDAGHQRRRGDTAADRGTTGGRCAHADDAMRAGARGYILTGSAPDDIIRAIAPVAAGEVILGAALARRMSHFFTAGRSGESHPFPELTTRERDVLDLIALGLPNQEIAAKLGLSEKTVRNNVSAIFAKLLVADRAGAIVKARDAGLGLDHRTGGETSGR
jgi:DNA-binding NarL/FixJ family response regulator